MKKVLILTVLALLLTAMPVLAWSGEEDICDTVFGQIYNECLDVPSIPEDNGKRAYDTKAIISIGSPNLIRLSNVWFLGVEAGKDVLFTDFDEGYYIQAALEWRGTLLDFSKDNE